jgi:hypothetical protein
VPALIFLPFTFTVFTVRTSLESGLYSARTIQFPSAALALASLPIEAAIDSLPLVAAGEWSPLVAAAE